jgi:RNA polymerase sigma factor (sigma-70 family)
MGPETWLRDLRRYTAAVDRRTDAQLLRAWRDGDKAAGRVLFERVFPSLRRFFASKVDDGIDDLIQTTLLVGVERCDDLREDERFRAYLFTVARNELFASLRKRSRVFDGSVSSIEDIATSPSGAVARRRDRELLVHALRRIPLDLQIALELHYWEDMKAREIGEVLGVPTSTITTRLSRARELVAQQLEAAEGRSFTAESASLELAQWALATKQAADAADEEA